MQRIDSAGRTEYAFDSMIPNNLRMLPILLIPLVFGCAHKYGQDEYQGVVNELNACTQESRTVKEDNENISKNIAQMQEKLDKTAQMLADAMTERQDLLDKNIQCLEEKKTLIKKISQTGNASQEKKESVAYLNKDYEYITSFLDSQRLSDEIYIIRAQGKIKIVIPQATLFPTAGSAWLTPKGTKLIKKIALGIKQLSPSAIEIAGHTDGTFVTNSKSAYPTNWHLAHARALAVLMIFNDARIKKETMCAISYADTKPIADNASEDGKAMNRRVEIILTP